MPDKTVLLTKKDMIATITLNRPEANNAFDFPMMEAIDNAINDVAGDKGIRVVIITGAGKGFCSGGDISYLGTLVEGRSEFARTVIGDVVKRIREAGLRILLRILQLGRFCTYN